MLMMIPNLCHGSTMLAAFDQAVTVTTFNGTTDAVNQEAVVVNTPNCDDPRNTLSFATADWEGHEAAATTKSKGGAIVKLETGVCHSGHC
jgi:hypothetical protein